MTRRNHTKDEVQEDDENAVYVEPNIEHELQKDKRQACRDIMQEIKEFGVNQRQILFLIQLLAMELENGDAMRSIIKSVGVVRKSVPVSRLIVPDKE